ncbi:dipicolinate synthase subunit DpsA [Paenibacillus sp. 7124]|uniref:Dipicolinate synthase subunit DpsA n=1 Tax=Paenibacillus apii TaxID=1850370 RepID=A0A6M1PL46_9BACL|nr:dipicolinate synthase subunit DpsA [Paenibacillus apii]
MSNLLVKVAERTEHVESLIGKKVVLIGGDNRQLEVIRVLAEQGADVQAIGFDNLLSLDGAVKTSLSVESLCQADAVILPVTGTDEYGKAESAFSSEELILTEDLVALIPKHAKIFTGIANRYLRDLCKSHRLELIELFERDDVAIYNSIPTAEGAVMMAIQHTAITIHGSTCMVLGLGRVGMTLARTLNGLGASVKAGVNKPEVYARAWEMGFNAFYTSDLQCQVKDVHIIFNTIPSLIITQDILTCISKETLIIDLASRPGGTDFRFAKEQGIKALLAPGLPGIVAPKTAGRILGKTISELLLQDKQGFE